MNIAAQYWYDEAQRQSKEIHKLECENAQLEQALLNMEKRISEMSDTYGKSIDRSAEILKRHKDLAIRFQKERDQLSDQLDEIRDILG